MTDAVFEVAFANLMKREGGYVCDPSDPGGETKYGISAKSHPREDIKNLTLDRAKAIYATDWWLRYGLWRLPPRIGVKMLDLGVNMGMAAATMCLQRALVACGARLAVDGVLGPQTRQACSSANCGAVLDYLRQAAWSHYQDLIEKNPALAKFADGWEARAFA